MRAMLRAGYNSHSGFGLNIFSDDELYSMHLATLEVLDTIGVGIRDEESQEIWRLSDVLLIKIRMRYAFLSTLWKMPFALHPTL